MNDGELQRLADENFGLHSRKIPSLTRGMKLFSNPGITWVDSGLACDTFNVIHISDGNRVTAHTLEMALNHYRERNFPYCIWISDENLAGELPDLFSSLGLQCHNSEPGMVLNLEDYSLVNNRRHADIRIVGNRAGLEDFAQVIAANWDPPDPNILKYYATTTDHYLQRPDEIMPAVFYFEGLPVSVVEIFSSGHGVAGLYGLATLQQYRGRGIGSAVMTFALNHLKRLGYRHIILQASEDGIGIYEKMGFRKITVYREFA